MLLILTIVTVDKRMKSKSILRLFDILPNVLCREVKRSVIILNKHVLYYTNTFAYRSCLTNSKMN